jgi:hypothetical protein
MSAEEIRGLRGRNSKTVPRNIIQDDIHEEIKSRLNSGRYLLNFISKYFSFTSPVY